MRMGLTTVVVLGAMAFLPDADSAQAAQASREQQVAATIAAVVTLRAYDSSGTAIGQGSGFFLPDGRIATNRHVLEGAAVLEARGAKGELVGSYSHASAIAFSTDLAILPKTQEPAWRISLRETNPSVGTHLYVVGAPLGLQNTVSDGIVSAMRTVNGENLLQMTAPISPGSSGGPVVDDAGMLIGVSVGLIPDGQNLNFAIPVEELKGLLASPEGTVSFPPRPNRRRSERPESNEPVYGLLESLPNSALSSADDLEFRIGLLGCFGNRAHDVIVCVCDFRPTAARGRQRTLGVWRATLQTLAGGYSVSDVSSDLTTAFPFSAGNRGAVVRSTGASVRLFFRFVAPYETAARNVLEMGVGNRQVDRIHRFAPVPIVEVDEVKDQTRSLFGTSQPSR